MHVRVIKKNLEQQLKFERLLTDIAARFVAVPGQQLDQEIKITQKQLCEHLDIDLCVLWQLSTDARSLWLTHIHAPPEFKPLPEILDARESFPWFLEKMMKKEAIITNGKSDLPPEAAKDLESWNYYGIESALTFPLTAGGGPVFGSLTFCVLKSEREWEPEVINRLQLVAQIFSSALARKIAEKALRESETRASLAAEAAKAGLWMLDKNTGMIWATERARNIFKFNPQEAINFEKFIATVHPEDRERIRLNVEKSFQNGTEYYQEYRIVPADGNLYWVSAQGRLVPDKANCLIGVLIDISERKRSEMEMRNMRRDLMHVSRVGTLNELATSIAHEINQPITAILNNAESALLLLSSKKPDLKEIRTILNEIIQDDTRAASVIQQQRALSKKQELEFGAVEISELIAETVRFVQSEVVMRKKSISINCSTSLPSVYGDRIQLQQVLLNLITNGLEAMAENDLGTNRLIIGAERKRSLVRIFVTDSGPGIRGTDKQRIFEPFYTTKPTGLGMGLAVCRSIVEAHGGQLEVKNNPGGGATFYFSLPRVKGI